MPRISVVAAAAISLCTAAHAQNATVMLQGVEEMIPVQLTTVATANRTQSTGSHGPALKALLDSLPELDSPQATLLRMANRAGQTFWIGSNSSMGQISEEILYGHFDDTLNTPGMRCELLAPRPSLLQELLGQADGNELLAGTQALVNLIRLLTDPNETQRPVIDRPVLFKQCMGDQQWTNTTVFYVDPSPFSGPETHAFAVVIRSLGSE